MPAIPAAQIPETNGLLAELPPAERERLYPHLEPVTVLDRPGLEARACECYEVVRRESDRLLPATLAA
jgi:hypothetical protein